MQKLGELLKSTREEKKISLRDAANATKIRQSLLEALENNDYGVFTSDTHLKSFLRSYANFLNINEDKALALYRRERQLPEENVEYIETRSNANPLVTNITHQLLSIRTLIFLAIILFIGVVIAFFYSQWVVFTRPPTLLITSPSENSVITDENFVIEGVTDNTFVKVVVDGNEASFTDANGRFKVDAKFTQEGSKRFTIIAKNEFQRETQVNLDLTYDAPALEVQKQKVKIANTSAVSYTLTYSKDNRSNTENAIIPAGGSTEIEYDSRIDVKNFDNTKLDVYISNDTIPTESIDSKEFSIIIENSRLIIKTKG